MKNSIKNIQKRREQLLNIIKTKQITTIHELSTEVDVSEMSVRRDCHVLQEMGKIVMSFGKISYCNTEVDNSENTQIDLINNHIAQAAVSYIDNDQMIFINSSRTAIRILDYLNNKTVNVITNNLLSVNNKLNSASSLVLSGGEIRNNSHILTGDIALENFRNIRASISLIGCAGLDVNNGLTTTNIHEAQINRVIVKNCEKLIVLANYTKINKTTNFKIGSIENIDVLITDIFADETCIDEIKNMGIKVIQVSV